MCSQLGNYDYLRINEIINVQWMASLCRKGEWGFTFHKEAFEMGLNFLLLLLGHLLCMKNFSFVYWLFMRKQPPIGSCILLVMGIREPTNNVQSPQIVKVWPQLMEGRVLALVRKGAGFSSTSFIMEKTKKKNQALESHRPGARSRLGHFLSVRPWTHYPFWASFFSRTKWV